MKIKLQGIGIIKNSEIELDGLTVITGDNNSGKTTVGKVVYSLFDGVSDLAKRAETDKNNYALNSLKGIIYNFDFLSDCFDMNSQDNPELTRFFKDTASINPSQAIQTTKKLYDWLINFRKIGINSLNERTKKRVYERISYRLGGRKNDSSHFEDAFNFLLNEAIDFSGKLLEDFKSDPHLIDYTRESISQTLKVEFTEQIHPVKADVENSSIIVYDNDKTIFKINIENNEIINNGEPVYNDSALNRAFFIDDPFILDSEDNVFPNDFNCNNDENFSNNLRICRHDVKLRHFLKIPTSNIFEKNILEKKYGEITAKINEVISGDFSFSNDGDYYISNGRKLHISNMAAGSKLFAILKLLVSKGALTDSTILILDEPEAHLHPAWQNKFAEVIVMLVKELGVKVLLTSHSPNFVLAIDAFMRKYEINDKTHFYQTGFTDDGFAEYNLVDDDMGKIYSDFVQYLTEVKLLRNKYMHGSEEDDD